MRSITEEERKFLYHIVCQEDDIELLERIIKYAKHRIEFVEAIKDLNENTEGEEISTKIPIPF